MGIELSINLYKLHKAYTINKAIIEGIVMDGMVSIPTFADSRDEESLSSSKGMTNGSNSGVEANACCKHYLVRV